MACIYGYTHMVQYRRRMSLDKNDASRGARLKALRAARKLTQRRVAAHLGVDVGTVSRWEIGRVLPMKTLERLAGFYGVDPQLIIFGDKDDGFETYPAFAEYKAWLDKHPEKLAALPEGALETIRTLPLRVPKEYEPDLQSYMILHSFMEGLKKKKRSRG